jgi:hypothetical protein
MLIVLIAFSSVACFGLLFLEPGVDMQKPIERKECPKDKEINGQLMHNIQAIVLSWDVILMIPSLLLSLVIVRFKSSQDIL